MRDSGSNVSYSKCRVRFSFCSTGKTRNVRMWSYHVILLFSYLVPLQPHYSRLWFLSTVKLNLNSSVLDEGSPRETHSEDSYEPLLGNVHLFQNWHLGDISDKGCLTQIMDLMAGELCVNSDCRGEHLCRWREEPGLSALLLVFPIACRVLWRKANPFSYHMLHPGSL